MKCCSTCWMVLPLAAFQSPRANGRVPASCRVCEAERAQLRRHGVTSREKEVMADAQHGCALCGRPEPGGKGWVVDHDRSCCPGDPSCVDCRRGVLCQWCNNALGYAMDRPELLRRMADYLELGTRIHPETVGEIRTCIANAIAPSESHLRLHTDGRDGLTKKSLQDVDKSFPSVPRARIPTIHTSESPAALRASQDGGRQ